MNWSIINNCFKVNFLVQLKKIFFTNIFSSTPIFFCSLENNLFLLLFQLESQLCSILSGICARTNTTPSYKASTMLIPLGFMFYFRNLQDLTVKSSFEYFTVAFSDNSIWFFKDNNFLLKWLRDSKAYSRRYTHIYSLYWYIWMNDKFHSYL